MLKSIVRPTFITSDSRCHHESRGSYRSKTHKRNEGYCQTSQCAFQVAWQINPHMKIGGTHSETALREHRGLRRTLLDAGAAVFEVPFVHGAFDSVFIKDNAVLAVTDDGARAFMARPKCGERQIEQEARALALQNLGFEIAGWSRENLEGGDLVVCPASNIAYLGYGFRSDPEASIQLEEFLGMPVTTLELVDPYFYHLDTALTIFSDGIALAYRPAFSLEAWQKLERSPAVRRLVSVSRKDAMVFGLNCVEVGNEIVIGAEASAVARMLERLGRKVRVTPLQQFQLAGGSTACLAAPVHYLGNRQADAI